MHLLHYDTEGAYVSEFKLTYSTMFDPPRALHESFSSAVAAIASEFGSDHGLIIDGRVVTKKAKTTKRDPSDHKRVLGHFSLADASDIDAAVTAARRAWSRWRSVPWQDRIRLLTKAARLIDERLYRLGAAVSLEVGKNRMEALGEVAEVSAFFDLYAQQLVENQGYDHALPDDPLPGFKSRNRSTLKPYGVWAVIAPFNYPFALAGGPTAAALAAGNTVILKSALDTPWSGLLLGECLRDAGVPDGVFNCIVGDGTTVGEALIRHDGIDGITFTGSHRVGMHILRTQAARRYPRPCIAEMGGKNAVIVSATANLDVATQGIVRSAYGMSGQKCSALSRIYVDKRVANELIDRLKIEIEKIVIGNPQLEDTWMGPVTTSSAYERFQGYCQTLRQDGARILAGGSVSADAAELRGYFCAPTLAEVQLTHPLWSQEMFVPLATVGAVENVEHAMRLTNASEFGLTAGFYGDTTEVQWFFDNIEAGVTYANRSQGATTGAWPGYQPFGGWKGSGSTGKALASFYYLPQYMREQSQTRLEP